MADVFLHIGLAKTGTTTIQAALDARVDLLAAAGVLFAGGSHRAQRLAAYDLLGQRIEGDDRDVVPGAFGRVADEIAAFTGRRVVVSEEELSHARPRHVRRLTRQLGPHRVFVVITVRDLARTLVSSWQQSVVQGGTTPWSEFIASVRDEDVATAPSDGLAFWLRQDLIRVIDTWTTVVPSDRIRIVTVPPPGSGEHVLLDRFAAATGLPQDVWGAEPVRPRNVSLGAAELELVRRLNHATSGRLTIAQYRFVMEAGLRPRWHVQHPRPLRLPAEHLPWARERGERLAAELGSRGHPVVGDLSDLVPGPATCGAGPTAVIPDDELLVVAEAAVAALALAHGALFKRYRRSFFERQGRWPSPAEVMGSSSRAVGFWARKAALRGADQHRVLAWAARTYVRRTSRGRPGA
jgi:hypothetical protein